MVSYSTLWYYIIIVTKASYIAEFIVSVNTYFELLLSHCYGILFTIMVLSISIVTEPSHAAEFLNISNNCFELLLSLIIYNSCACIVHCAYHMHS